MTSNFAAVAARLLLKGTGYVEVAKALTIPMQNVILYAWIGVGVPRVEPLQHGNIADGLLI